MRVVAALVLLPWTSALRTYPTEGVLPEVQLSTLPGLPTLEDYLRREADAREEAQSQIAMASTPGTAVSSADFRENFQAFVERERFRKDQDVYVTMGDGAYSRYFARWSKHLASLGLRQQVIVCLDEESTLTAQTHHLPAVDQHGVAVWGRRGKKNKVGPLPLGVSTLKFLIPKLLLEENFQRVVFTEGDTYFFDNPSAYYPKHGSYASMDDGRFRSLNLTNIGFMVFSGKGMLKVIDDYLGLWDREYAKVRAVLRDQHVFQDVLKKYPQDRAQVFLDNVRFSLGPRQVRADTVVAHFAFACAECKRFLLDHLYEHHPKAEDFVETVKSTKGMFPHPVVEC